MKGKVRLKKPESRAPDRGKEGGLLAIFATLGTKLNPEVIFKKTQGELNEGPK